MKDTKKTGITARQRAWNSMRIFRNFSVGDIEATAEIGRDNLQAFLRLLVDCGYVDKAVKPGTKRNVYALLHDTGPRTPRQVADEVAKIKGLIDPNTGEKILVNSDKTLIVELQTKTKEPATDRQRAWNAMRTLCTFTAEDIEKEAKIGSRNLLGFLSLLLLCGYLEIKEKEAVPSSRAYTRRNPRQEVYVLVKDSGEKTPKQVTPTKEEKMQYPLRLEGLRDPNTGTVCWPERKATLKEVMQWRG